MNRELKQRNRKGCSYRKRGGGYGLGEPLVPIQSSNDSAFSVKVPVNQSFSDCAFPERPGQIAFTPNPVLAQTSMAGGKTRRRGGFRSEYMPVNEHGTYKVELPITQGFPNCGGVNVPSTLMSQARPELAQTPMAGGRCPMCFRRRNKNERRTRKLRGGNRGFFVDPSMSVGGDGPNAAPANIPLPCDARAGSFNQLSQTPTNPDPRAPAYSYSLTPNQTGGSYGLSNGYSDGCYKAPGSSLPVYPAETAGFRFEPSTAQGSAMPDGVTAFNEVVPQPARVGGRRRRSKGRKHSRK